MCPLRSRKQPAVQGRARRTPHDRSIRRPGVSARERLVVEQIRRRMIELVRAGHSVVLDYRLWTRRQRDDYKHLLEQAGGRWRLLSFPVDRAELLRRLSRRNRQTDANSLTVTTQMLDDFLARFEAPANEGEETIPS